MPAKLFESMIACRKDPAPLSAVLVTVSVVTGTCWQAENSDVLFDGSVVVAVTNSPCAVAAPTVALIAALPLPSVFTVADPRNVRPSPLPDASHVAFEK